MEIKIMKVTDQGCETVAAHAFEILSSGDRVRGRDQVGSGMGTVVPDRMGNHRFQHGDRVTVEWDTGVVTTVLAEWLEGPYN